MNRTTLSCLFGAALSFSVAAHGAPLFERPLHIQRSLEEPLTGHTAVVDEYYLGQRAVTVRNERTVIVDYERREITEIDRASGTYAVTAFEQLAAARGERVAAKRSAAPTGAKPVIVRSGSDRRAGKNVETFTAEDGRAALRGEIAVDPSIELSRDAFDVVIGAAYPNEAGASAELARGAAKRSAGVSAHSAAAGAPERYALPMEQTFQWSEGGETMRATNRVLIVDARTAPADLVAIPPGAKLIDSRLLRSRKLADELEPSAARP